MSWRRVPVFATLIVLVAVAVMIALGFWQLDRLKQKEWKLADFERNQAAGGRLVAWPVRPDDHDQRPGMQYAQTETECLRVLEQTATAGKDAKGRGGWAHIAVCETPGLFERTEVVFGWSQDPAPRNWSGGKVAGTFLMSGRFGVRIVADPPLAGLEANARPDPRDMPNNHLAYAVQWFLFALTALVIYAIALRKRLKTS